MLKSFLTLSLLLLIWQASCQTVRPNTRGIRTLSLSVFPSRTAASDVLKVNFTFTPLEDLKAWKIRLDFQPRSVPNRAESAFSLTALSGGVFVLKSTAAVTRKNSNMTAQVSFISTRKNLILPANLIFMTVNTAGQEFYQTFKNDGTLVSSSNTTKEVFDVDFSNPQAATPAQLVSDLFSTTQVEKNKYTLSLGFKFKEAVSYFNIAFPPNTPLSAVNGSNGNTIAVVSRGLLAISFTEKLPAGQQALLIITAQLNDIAKAPQTYNLIARVGNSTKRTDFRVSYGVSSSLPKDNSTLNGNITLFTFNFTALANLTAWKIEFKVTGEFLNASSATAQLSRGSRDIFILSNDDQETLAKGKTRTVAFYVTRTSQRAKVEIQTFDIMTKDTNNNQFYQRFGREGQLQGTFDPTTLFISSNATETVTPLSELANVSSILNDVRAQGAFYLTINLIPKKNWDSWSLSLPKSVIQVKPDRMYTVLNSEGNMTLYSAQKVTANTTLTISIEGQLTRSEDSPTTVVLKANIAGVLYTSPLTLTRRGFQNGQLSFQDRFPNYQLDFTFTPWEDISSWVLRFRFFGEFSKITTEDFRVEWRNDDSYVLFPSRSLTKGKSYTFSLLYTLPNNQRKTVSPNQFSVMSVNSQGESIIQTFGSNGRMANTTLQPSAFNSTAPTTAINLPSEVGGNFSASVNVNASRPRFVFNFPHNSTWKGFFFRFVNSENSYLTQVTANCCTTVEDANSQVTVYSTKNFAPGALIITLQGTLKTSTSSRTGKTPSRLFFGTQVADKQLTTYFELPVKEANATVPTRRIVVQITLRGSKISFNSAQLVGALRKIFKLKADEVRVVTIGKRAIEMVEQDTTSTFPVNVEFSGNAAGSVVQNLTNMINNNDTLLTSNGIDATGIKVVDDRTDAPTDGQSGQNNDDSLSTGAIVGIAIGCFAFVVIVIVVLAVLLRSKSSGPRSDQQPILY